ncbi:MAG: hypothetical protein MK135_05540 [Polyangiaceae bacterium]|nr:hypothetical protein [Polyangiaceae bacterium]
MRRFSWICLVALAVSAASSVWTKQAKAAGDGATAFNLYVPPNNVRHRDSYLIVTNVAPQTATVDIEDDDTDGDSDDSVATTLAQGESYIIRIKDGAVNDDIGGKKDGDYFKVRSDHPVVVQMATKSNWQHDWVPSESGGRGTNFFVYAPASSGADNDANLYSYVDNTRVTIIDITTSSTISTGKTSVDLDAGSVVLSQVLHEGEDLIVRNQNLGLDILDPGHTYWVQASEPVTMQYGHLGQVSGGNQARDGAGFVPSANGSTTGSLYYFRIPHNPGRASEKELRISCFDASTVSLSGADGNDVTWTTIADSSVAAGGHLDFTGSANSTFRDLDIYRLQVDPPYHRCTVFEGNWMETGSFGTSDFASAVSASNGANQGYVFQAYLGPPGKQENVAYPTGELTNIASPSQGFASHLYIYAKTDDTQVTVTDTDTDGELFNLVLSLDEDEYYDVVVEKPTYLSITNAGHRPYFDIAASEPIMVMNGNFNDNWMAFFHSVSPVDPKAAIDITQPVLGCSQTTDVTVTCSNDGSIPTLPVTAEITLPDELTIVSTSDGCEDAYAPYPTIYNTGDIFEYQGSNYRVDMGPIFSVTPNTAGHEHRFTNLGTCRSDLSGSSLTVDLGTLASGESEQFTLNVEMTCSGSSCVSRDLHPITVECTTTSGSDVYAHLASQQMTLQSSGEATITEFTVKDVPDYDSDPPDPRVELSFTVDAPAATTVVLTRVINDADPDATATTLSTFEVSTGVTNLTYDDSYSLHYQNTMFYRLESTTGSCTVLDGPQAIETSSGMSSGFDSGLESNGNLSTQLASRAIQRTQSSGYINRSTLETMGRFQVQSTAGMSGPSGSLGVMIPEIGPDNSSPVNVTPADLPALTNAGEVAAVDYINESGEHVGSLLIVKTEGEVYEHSKALCDRAEGGTLDMVKSSILPTGRLLRFASRKNSAGEYATIFKAFEQNGVYEVHSAWLKENYPKPAEDDSVLNIQAWSSLPGYDIAIAEDVISRLKSIAPENAHVPASYFESVGTLGGVIQADLAGDPAVQMRRTFALEDGEAFVEEINLNDSKAVAAPRRHFKDVTLELMSKEGVVIDRAWVSDGAWAPMMDEMAGGFSELIEQSYHCETAREIGTNQQMLSFSGCAQVKGTIDDFAGVARHFGGVATQMTLAKFSTMSARIKSERPVQVCLHSSDGSRSCQDVAPDLAERTVLRLNDFYNDDCSTQRIDSPALISFVVEGAGEFDLNVSELSFGPEAQPTSRGRNCDSSNLGESGSWGCRVSVPSQTQVPYGLLAITLAFGWYWRMRRRAVNRE